MKKLIFPLTVILLLVLAACQPAPTAEVPSSTVEEPSVPTELPVVNFYRNHTTHRNRTNTSTCHRDHSHHRGRNGGVKYCARRIDGNL